MSKQGKTVLYSEDGGRYECLVLTDTSGPGKDQYKLRVIQVFNQDRYGHEVEPGDEFDVMQRTDMGAWEGMWHVADIIGSSKTSLHKEMYRWFIEYARASCRGNAFVRAENETEARSQFRSLYPGASIERITCLGDAEISDRAHRRARCVP